jgi:hypothetical protein
VLLDDVVVTYWQPSSSSSSAAASDDDDDDDDDDGAEMICFMKPTLQVITLCAVTVDLDKFQVSSLCFKFQFWFNRHCP